MQCSAFLAGALAASRSSSTPSFSLHSKPPSAAAGAGPASTSTAQSAASAHVPVRALIVAPKTLLAHWEKELRVCGMGRATYSFYGSSEGERSTVLTTLTRCVHRVGGGGVCKCVECAVHACMHTAKQLLDRRQCVCVTARLLGHSCRVVCCAMLCVATARVVVPGIAATLTVPLWMSCAVCLCPILQAWRHHADNVWHGAAQRVTDHVWQGLCSGTRWVVVHVGWGGVCCVWD